MNDNTILNEYFIWEENNYIKQNQNNYKLDEKDNCVTMNETKNDSTNNDWRNITDPKLRKKIRMKAWREANKDKRKVYNQINKDKIRVQNKTYYQVNKDKIKDSRKIYNNKTKTYQKTYHQVNKDKIKDYQKIYRGINKEKIYKQQVEWKLKNKNNVQYKLSCRLRERLGDAIKNNYKSGSAVRDLGCTIDELKIYLESKFQLGMTWDNWTKDGWHIDHIKPLASFDLTDRNQLLEACHYTNLQPLWAQDNLSKGDKFPENPHQPLDLAARPGRLVSH